MNVLLKTDVLPRNAQLKPTLETMDFRLPPELEASEPPEARGLTRDTVRLMVSYRADNAVVHSQFRDLADFLKAGDVLVINTSGTMNAALNVTDADDTPFELHLSTHLPADLWIVEVREPCEGTTKPYYTAQAGTTYQLPGEAQAVLITPYNSSERAHPGHTRLWIATLNLPCDVKDYLAQYGFPIRYSYVRQGWANSYYQTVYATEMGSAEMPSAGRAFTPELLTRLLAKGVQIVPLILHTGVASLEDHEPPYEEFYRVPSETAHAINSARLAGKRIIAVGTTVVRALETVTDEDCVTHPGEGWTRVIITPQRGIRAVNAMLTGMHEPRATHLAMLEALASREHLRTAYEEALSERYLWHEFGDLHLILP
ncbi:MAG: S-adenosylmethionine:tRNA ribosyltransferase-isomerase [Anaerolineae bacterium]